MKKLILNFVLIAVIFVGLCSLLLTITHTYAEEVEEPVETVQETDEEVNSKLSVAISKLNELTGEENYFKNKILPYIINGAADLIIIGVFVIRPYLKKKSLADKLSVAAAQLKAENESLQTILNSTDPDKIKESLGNITSIIPESILTAIKGEFTEFYKALTELKTTNETDYALLKILVEAARLAWSSKPEVAAILAESPEKSTLERFMAYIDKLEEYIRESKGEEAEETLKQLEG